MWEYTLRKTINIFALLIQTPSNIISHLINFYFRISFTSSAQGVHLAKSICLKNETKPEEKNKKEKRYFFFFAQFFRTCKSKFHRSTEYAELEVNHKDHWVQSPTLHMTSQRVTEHAWEHQRHFVFKLILAVNLAVFSPKKLREYSE